MPPVRCFLQCLPGAHTRVMECKMLRGRALLAIVLLTAPTSVPPARTEEPAGKTVQMIIGFGPGGGYDLWGRTVARHIGRHLPGHPNVVPQNMPGAGSYVAASHIFNVAPRDGTALGNHRA